MSESEGSHHAEITRAGSVNVILLRRVLEACLIGAKLGFPSADREDTKAIGRGAITEVKSLYAFMGGISSIVKTFLGLLSVCVRQAVSEPGRPSPSFQTLVVEFMEKGRERRLRGTRRAPEFLSQGKNDMEMTARVVTVLVVFPSHADCCTLPRLATVRLG